MKAGRAGRRESEQWMCTYEFAANTGGGQGEDWNECVREDGGRTQQALHLKPRPVPTFPNSPVAERTLSRASLSPPQRL